MKPERRIFIEWAKEEVPEPRVASLVTYPLTEILFVVFVGVLCGMEDVDEIADAALAKTCTTHTTTDSGHGRIG